MNPIFGPGPALSLRFAIVSVLSIVAMLTDTFTDSAKQIRSLISTAVSPVQYVADLPQQAFESLTQYASSKQFLLDENQRLRQIQLLQNEKLQRLTMLTNENNKLRKLLGTDIRVESKKEIAEIMAIASNPYSHDVVINKGSSDRVYQGQPVLDDLGVVGQVLSVGNNTARVILLTDQTHAVPVRNLRNDVQGVLSGTGNINRMILNDTPHDTDIKVGDTLITSGLGGVFPDGYPVAKVVEVKKDLTKPFLNITAVPVAQVNRLKYVLILWPKESPESPNATQNKSEKDSSDKEGNNG